MEASKYLVCVFEIGLDLDDQRMSDKFHNWKVPLKESDKYVLPMLLQNSRQGF